MKTYKQRCLNAIDILIDEWSKNEHTPINTNCSLCTIYYSPSYCKGCPNSVFFVHITVIKSKTCNKAVSLGCFNRKLNIKSTSLEESKLHAEFWRQAKKHLETLPNMCFALSTSKASDFKGLLIINEKVY